MICPLGERHDRKAMCCLIDEYDAARVLSISTADVRRLVKRGEIPTVELPGGQVRFDPSDLRAWAESLKRPVEPKARAPALA